MTSIANIDDLVRWLDNKRYHLFTDHHEFKHKRPIVDAQLALIEEIKNELQPAKPERCEKDSI